MAAPAPIIDIIRHGQASHNVFGSNSPDPILTPTGNQQCYELRQRYPFGSKVTHIFSSPLRRAIETSLYSIHPVVKDEVKVVLLPELQEVNDTPSSTGSPKDSLIAQYSGGAVDFSNLIDNNWNNKGPDGPYMPEPSRVEARALIARQFLRMTARNASERGRKEVRIVVVTHGEFVHWLTGDFEGVSYYRNSGWANTELRSYRFVGDSVDAPLVETQESRQQRGANIAGLDARKNELAKRVAKIRIQEYARESERRHGRLMMMQKHQMPEDEDWIDDEPEMVEDVDAKVDDKTPVIVSGTTMTLPIRRPPGL